MILPHSLGLNDRPAVGPSHENIPDADVHTEFWWVRYARQVMPAEVLTVRGIPMLIDLPGVSNGPPVQNVDLLERLPDPEEVAARAARRDRLPGA